MKTSLQALSSGESHKAARSIEITWHRLVFGNLWLALIALSFVISPNNMSAQTSYGSVVGTVTDPAGSVVAGAQVQLTNKGTNAKQASVTGTAGTYTFINLNPGEYSITVTNQGFKAATNSQVSVNIGGVTRADLALQIGDVSQSVTVTGASSSIQTDSASLGGVIEGVQVLEAPLNGRNVNNLLDFVPAVIPGGGT